MCTGRSENEIWVEAGENETKRGGDTEKMPGGKLGPCS